MNPGGVSVTSGKPIPGDLLVVFSTAERTATDRTGSIAAGARCCDRAQRGREDAAGRAATASGEPSPQQGSRRFRPRSY